MSVSVGSINSISVEAVDSNKGPYPLVHLSTAAVYGISFKESIRYLAQLSPKEAIETAIAINNKMGTYCSKYESYLGGDVGIRCSLNYDDLCFNSHDKLNNSEEISVVIGLRAGISKIIDEVSGWGLRYSFSIEDSSVCGIHPIYQVVHSKNTEDVISSYYERRDEILALPDPSLLEMKYPNSLSPERIAHYRDPLYFLSSKYALCNLGIDPYFSIQEFILYPMCYTTVVLGVSINKLICYLNNSVKKISGKLYNLIMALLLQIRYYNASLIYLIFVRGKLEETIAPVVHEREVLIIKSLNIIILLRNYIKYVSTIREIFMPFLEFHNFVRLEDVMKIIESRILDSHLSDYRSTYELEIRNISSFLRNRYDGIIINKRMRIKSLLGRINLNDENTLNSICLFLGINIIDHTLSKEVIIEKLSIETSLDAETKSTKGEDKLVFVNPAIESVKDLMKDISEMVLFLSKPK